MNTKIVILLVLLTAVLGSAFAQSFGSVDHDKAEDVFNIDDVRGFTAQIEMNTNMFQWTGVKFSDEKERFRRSGYSLVDNYPFGNTNFLDGTNIGFAYNDDWYGGNVSLNRYGLGGIKAWIGFWNNRLKISAGNDLGYSYADSQGADAGLRVYDDSVRNTGEGEKENETIDTSKNPDNITRDQGVLIELDFVPVKVALAGGGNFFDLNKNMGSTQNVSTGTYTQDPVYGRRMQYGINIGSTIGEIARVNGAYILQSEKNETLYEYLQTTKEMVPKQADTEISTHLFGIYGSVYPFRNDSLGITAGYAGMFVQYLEEYSANISTVMPQIMKNGINLTARYKMDRLTVKTDHNYSFWTDKNYRIFNLHKPYVSLVDYGLKSADTNAADFADVTHSFLWNGIGASYNFTPVFEGSLYTRNLVRLDETSRYRMMNNYFSVELKSTFRLGPMVEAWGGIVFQFTGRVTSKELSEDTGEFPPGFAPGETNDSKSMIQIPVGFRVKLQRSF